MSTVLRTFLTEIADAIREKTGKTTEINAQNFASEIQSIDNLANVTVIDTEEGMVDLIIS